MGAQSHQNLIFSLWWQDSWAVGTTPQDPLSGGNPHVDDDHDDGDNDDGDDDDSDDDDDRDDDDENRSSNSIHNGWSMIKQAQKNTYTVFPQTLNISRQQWENFNQLSLSSDTPECWSWSTMDVFRGGVIKYH